MGAQLVFVLGSGRCGTKLIGKVLSGHPNVEANHEYVRDAYQREAALYAMGVLEAEEISNILKSIHGSAAMYCTKEFFVDSSNKLVNVADLLPVIFPDAKFIHLYRDGRNVVSSFYNKLGNNIYNDRYVDILMNWFEGQRKGPMPPPPEEYWWPIPRSLERRKDFSYWNQFQRICYHWERSNRMILNALESIDPANKLSLPLEDLVTSEAKAMEFCAFFNIPFDQSIRDILNVPTHVYVPIDFGLTTHQATSFEEICGIMMERLGYDLTAPISKVKY